MVSYSQWGCQGATMCYYLDLAAAYTRCVHFVKIYEVKYLRFVYFF